ncbi:Immunoglobulin superfamily member 10 [Trichoplax sp. H2]|nr:Immunoglobulin superfamily member 10 [Trichoplax sp. H2]|eukprot:RDD44470.1 Immunoglobulin superfamily member 10 [Trichoplax sp. H2]
MVINLFFLTLKYTDSFGIELDDSYSARRGKPFSVKVKIVGGTPPFKYLWKFNGTTVSTKETFRIEKVALQDGGDYYCQVTDSKNKVATTTFTLNITYLDTTDSQEKINVITVNRSGNALLDASANCYTSGMMRNWSVTVSPDCVNINYTDPLVSLDTGTNMYELQNGSFVIENVEIKDRKKCFICSIFCGSIHAELRYRLNVIYFNGFSDFPKSQITINQSSTLDLNCSADGNPPPRVGWFKSSVQLGHGWKYGTASYKIANATRNATGVYTCKIKAGNFNPELSNSTTIVVQYIDNKLIFHRTKADMPRLGSKLPYELSCTAQGYPVPTFKWYKDQKNYDNDVTSLPNHNTSTITWKRFTAANNGIYTCQATNIVKSVSSSKAVFLYEPAKITVAPFNNHHPIQEVEFGKYINITCSATGFPTAEVKLEIQDKNMHTSESNTKEGKSSASLYHLFEMSDNNSNVICTASITFRGHAYFTVRSSHLIIVRSMKGSPVATGLGIFFGALLTILLIYLIYKRKYRVIKSYFKRTDYSKMDSTYASNGINGCHSGDSRTYKNKIPWHKRMKVSVNKLRNLDIEDDDWDIQCHDGDQDHSREGESGGLISKSNRTAGNTFSTDI